MIAELKALRVAEWLADRGYGDPRSPHREVAVRDDGTVELTAGEFLRLMETINPNGAPDDHGYVFGVRVEPAP